MKRVVARRIPIFLELYIISNDMNVYFFPSVVSSCVSHPCLHGGTCIDTSFVAHRPMDASLMYGSVAVRPDSQSFICKCQSPYAGPMCEGIKYI